MDRQSNIMNKVVTKGDEITTVYGIDDSAEIPAVENLKDKKHEQIEEIDEETTTEEDEELSEIEDPLSEINFLQEESNVSIHELMLLYNYPNNTSTKKSTKKPKEYKKKSSQKKIKNKKIKKNVLISSSVAEKSVKPTKKQKLDDDIVEKVNINEGDPSTCKISEESPKENESIEKAESGNDTSELFDLLMADIDQVQNEDEDEDEDYKPHEDKCINVGLDFQALVTDGLSTYGNILPYENNDELLWDPHVLNEDLIEDYLIKIHEFSKEQKSKFNIIGTQDNEKALNLLVQCKFNLAEALRRISLNPTTIERPLSGWSEMETKEFKQALLNHGKNFHAIQKKVKTKSVAELVHFYYIWKRTKSFNEFEK